MKILFTLLAMLTLSACGGTSLLGKPPAPDELYVLKADAPPLAKTTLPVSLKIARPEAAPGLDTHRIAVREGAHRLNYYNGGAWAGPLPEVMQTFLVDAFDQSHAFRAVGGDGEGLKTDLTLVTEIRDCAVDMTGAGTPSIRLRLSAKLVDSIGREVIAALPVEKTVKAEANRMPALLDAFNQAFNQAAQELITATAQVAGDVRKQ